MNRAIKFRVWCIDQQEYEKEETALTPDGRLFRKYKLDGIWRDDSKLHIVEMFTGLLDKNGVEVYEGDILKIGNYLYDIYWEQGCFRYKQRSEYGHSDVVWGMNTKIIKIIGNIHTKEETK